MKNQNDTPLKRLWRRTRFLIDPPPDINDLQQRRQTTLLSALLLIIIVSGSISGVTQLIVVPGFQSTFNVIAGGVAVLIVAYILTRTKYYRVAALIASTTPSIVSYAVLLENTSDQSAFVFMLVGVLLSGILLNRWFTFGIAVLNLLGLALLPVVQPAWVGSSLAGPISFHVIIPALILIAMWHWDLVENDRQEVLRESEARYRTIVESTTDLVCRFLPDTTLTFVNTAYCQYFGKDPRELVGMRFLEMIPRDGWNAVQGQIDAIIAMKDPFAYEHEVVAPNGEVRWQQWTDSPILDDSGQVVELQSVGRDITESRQMEDALRVSEQRLRFAMEGANDGIWDVQMETGEVYMSPRGCEILGYLPSEMSAVARVWSDLVHPDDLPLTRERLTAHLDERTPIFEVEQRLRTKSGTWKWVLARGKLVERDALGKPLRMTGTHTDITERKRAEAELRASQEFRNRVFESSQIPIVVMEATSYNFIDCNQAAISAYRFASKEETLGKSLLDVSAPTQSDGTTSAGKAIYFINLALTQGSVVFEWRHQRPSGEIWDAEVHLLSFSLDDRQFLQFSLIDITQRKKTEEALRESEALYRQAIQVAGAVPYLQSYRTGITGIHYDFIGEGIRQITGYDPEEFNLQLWDSLIHESILLGELRQYSWEDAIRRVRTGDHPVWKCEHRIQARDGSIHWVLETAVELRDQTGVSHGSIGMFQDITERKVAEKALQESERRFREMLQGVELAGVMLDEAGRIMFINDFLLRITGWSREEMLGESWFDKFLPEELREGIRAAFGSLMTGEQAMPHYENEILTRRAERRLIRWNNTILFDSNGKIIGTASIGEDITERKQAEEALKENEAIFSSFLEHSPVYVFFKDKKIRSLRLSKNYEQMLGIPLRDLLGKTMDDLFPSDLAKSMVADDMRILHEGKRIDVVEELNGRVYETTKFPVLKDGEPILLAGFTVDITERKQAEQEREKLITELEAKNIELERFTYTVSHDLKSPLVTIKGFLGFLKQDIASGNLERQQNDIERINNAALKMEQLLRDLLELSRIGRLVGAPEVIPFEYLAGEAMDLVHGQLEARGVTVQIQPDLPPVYGDRRRLAEVLQNLLDNAAKYMGGQADPRVEIGQRGEVNGNPLFYVRDNGIGIETQHHDRIFGLFNKLDPGSEGTGIGLALVKRVIEFHGGRIWVESEPGIGSTFFFTLPSRPATDSVI